MIKSANLTFSDNQVLTASAVSTNVLDFGATGTVVGASAALTRDIGPGEEVPLRIQLTADATGTAPTIQANLEVATDAAFTTPVVVASSVTLSGGKAGDVLSIDDFPVGTNLRYARLSYTLGGTTPRYQVFAGVVHGIAAG